MINRQSAEPGPIPYAIGALNAGNTPGNVVQQLLSLNPGMPPDAAKLAVNLAINAMNTAATIIPGAPTMPSDIPGDAPNVTVIIETIVPIGPGAQVTTDVNVVLPRDGDKPIWDEIVSDFWKWFRDEYKHGVVPSGSSLPTFEILGVY